MRTAAIIPSHSANARARISDPLISPAAAGFRPIAEKAANPISPSAIAGQKTANPKARASI